MAIKMSEKAYQDYLSKVHPVSPTPKMPAKRIHWLGMLFVFVCNVMRVR